MNTSLRPEVVKFSLSSDETYCESIHELSMLLLRYVARMEFNDIWCKYS